MPCQRERKRRAKAKQKVDETIARMEAATMAQKDAMDRTHSAPSPNPYNAVEVTVRKTLTGLRLNHKYRQTVKKVVTRRLKKK